MFHGHHVVLFVSTALLLATGRGGRAEYVRGEITGWAAVSQMTADASFGNIWKATLTSASDVGFSEYKFDRYGDVGWTENWGLGSSATINLTPGTLAGSGDNLSFSRLNGKRYSFQMAADHTAHVLMETDADPVGITGVSDDHASAGLGPVQVSITLSAPRSPQETIYVRYATNIAFPSSWLVAASGSGANIAASLPAYAAGTRVYYYVLSSTLPTGQIMAAADLCTLRGKNAGTSNFAYEVSGSTFTGVVPSAEFTENNAAQWGSFSTVDFAPTSVSNDTTRVKLGAASIRFDTQSGFATGVRYPATSTSHWDVSSFTHLEFWAYAINTTTFGFQDPQPIVRLLSPAGTHTYTPGGILMYNNTWHRYRIPLAGDSTWTRTSSGAPSLLDVTQLEIQHDTWDSGFTVFYDGLRFVNLNPTNLPPAGPPPPSGVNPDAIEPKVLLFIYDPIVESMASQRMHQAYGWTDPAWLAHQAAGDLRSNSHDLVRYQIVATNIVDGYPYFLDGYQFDDASFHTTWTSRVEHASMFDYKRFVTNYGIEQRIQSGEIDEVWLYTMPFVGTWESTMAGDGGYWCNSTPVAGVPSTRLFVIMGLNYERGVAEAIHSYGHRAESIMVHSYGTWLANTNNAWNTFTLYHQQLPNQGHVGNIHFPVNGQSDYDYTNTIAVPSYHQRWLTYPNLGNGAAEMVNVATWSPTGVDPHRDYLNWWYRHLPHVSGRGPDHFMNNWWRYIADPDQFKSGDGNLLFTEGIPSAQVLTLTNGAEVCGRVPVTVSAAVDGALGRVDLYVDGQYHASDTLSPYTFTWDVSGLSGLHTLAAKAVELQNGTESTSAVVNVMVQPMALSALSAATGGLSITWHSCANWTSVIQRANALEGPWISDTNTLSVATTSSTVHTRALMPTPGQTGGYFRVWMQTSP